MIVKTKDGITGRIVGVCLCDGNLQIKDDAGGIHTVYKSGISKSKKKTKK